MARMKRLQISLEPELDRQLGIHARREGISKAEVVRRSLRRVLEPGPDLGDDPFFKIIGLAGTEGRGLEPGESIDEIVYGRKANRPALR
jgi:hypothetical protein